jgi:DNA-binding CsgD family transcriptional regulator
MLSLDLQQPEDGREGWFLSKNGEGDQLPDADASKGGRPEWLPTKAQRKQISVAAAGGMSHDEIAIALGIARGTLEKHCSVELNQGACKRKFEVLNAMHRTALKGNVSAQKAFLAAGEPKLYTPPPDPSKPTGEKLGKKEQAQADAASAAEGTEWHSLLPGTQPLQ